MRFFSKDFSGDLTENGNWLHGREFDVWNEHAINRVNIPMYFARMGNLMFISNLFIQTSLKPEMWIILLYPSQPTSGYIFHSLIQFPVHKIFILSSLSQRKGWCLPREQLNICPKPFRESCIFFSFRWSEGIYQSPLPGISEYTSGIHSEIQPMTQSVETVLVCPW